MEAFEQFVAIHMESEGLVVSSAVKFRVRRKTKKAAYDEYQTHGYEVDLVGARVDKLVLATVKSFFGSRGVSASDVEGSGSHASLFRLLNESEIRDGVIRKAATRYGYGVNQVHLRLYVGKFADKKMVNERKVKDWGGHQQLESGTIEVFSAKDIIDQVKKRAAYSQYEDNPIIVALKVLEAAHEIELPKKKRAVSIEELD
jgi:hypothetical protein